MTGPVAALPRPDEAVGRAVGLSGGAGDAATDSVASTRRRAGADPLSAADQRLTEITQEVKAVRNLGRLGCPCGRPSRIL
jgi:hypothetical protein